MKKWLYGLVVLLLLAGGYAAAAHFSGGAFPTLGLPLGGDRGWLRTQTLSFWEDIQFKDFDSAAAYHDPMEQNAVDIPYLLERMFLVKPEALDIMTYEIVLAEVDSTGLRARVKTRVKVKNLLDEGIKEKEVMLYWQRCPRRTPGTCTWIRACANWTRTRTRSTDRRDLRPRGALCVTAELRRPRVSPSSPARSRGPP